MAEYFVFHFSNMSSLGQEINSFSKNPNDEVV